MKLLFITNLYRPHAVGGYELGCEEIAQCMKLLGHEVVIATSKPHGRLLTTAAPDDSIRVERIFTPIHEYDVDGRLSGSRAWRRRRNEAYGGIIPANCLALERFAKTERPDAIWAFNTLGLGPVGLLETATFLCGNVIHHLMDDIDGVIADHQRDEWLQARYYRTKASVRAIGCSDKILKNNGLLGPYLDARNIPNHFDFSRIHTMAPESRPLGKDGLRCVYFGQVSAAKGVDQLVSAMATFQATPQGHGASLDIFGGVTDEFRKALTTIISTSPDPKRIVLRGRVNKEALMSCLSSYDVATMLLSDREPFAYAPLEALAAGLPVILTPGANRDVLPSDYPLVVKNRSETTQIVDRLQAATNPQLRQLAWKRAYDSVRTLCDGPTVVLPAYTTFLLEGTERKPRIASGWMDSLLSAHAIGQHYSHFNEP
jgi:glycogen synthase